jgi:hypothetical protein
MKIRILKRWPFGDRLLLEGSQIETVGPDERGITEKEACELIQLGVARIVEPPMVLG